MWIKILINYYQALKNIVCLLFLSFGIHEVFCGILYFEIVVLPEVHRPALDWGHIEVLQVAIKLRFCNLFLPLQFNFKYGFSETF